MCTHEKQFHYGVELPCAECDKRVVIDIEPLPVGTGPTKAVVQARLLNKPVLVTFVREQRRDAPDRWVEKPAES